MAELHDLDPFASDLLKPGQGFLQAVCETARREFGSQLALIGSLRIAESERMYVQAVSKQDPEIEIEYYDVCPAPCQRVLTEKRPVVYLEELNELYPADPGIRAFGSRSYVGCPLLDGDGASIGIMVLEWDRPLPQQKASQVVSALESIAPRVSAEVVNQVMSRAFDALVQPLDDPRQDETAIFRTIVTQAASLAQVKAAFVGMCIESTPKQFRLLSMVLDGEIYEEFEGQVFDYDGTPCRMLRDNDVFLLERGLQERFPNSEFYASQNFHSYFGYGFRKGIGKPVGHLAFFHDRPMSPRIASSKILRTVSGRAKQEMERYIAESERKSLEEALLNRKRLESLGLMAGTVAHDFNNQLMAIIGHTELALLELEPADAAYRSLKIAEDNLWRARDVIRDLMDFAGNSPKSGVEPVGLNEIVEHALELLHAERLSSCRIETDLEQELPRILGRPAQLHQIIANVLLNAVDATEGQEGILKVRTALRPIPAEERGKCLTGHAAGLPDPGVLLEISDNGRGMDTETAEHAFDPFFSTKDSSRGLGLAGVLGIARRMSAGLTLTSHPGLGTTVRLYFRPAPNADQAAVPREPREVAPETGSHRGSILVVDDEPSVLQTVAKQVRALGCRTIVAGSGDEAIALAEAGGEISAAILDVVMPGLDGWETLRRLRARLGPVPAIIMSGYNRSDASEKLESLEPVRILNKPFSRENLKQALTELLESQAAIRSAL